MFYQRLHANCCVFCVRAATLGCLEFSLLYEPENHALHCCIVKAKVRTQDYDTRQRRDETKQGEAGNDDLVKMLHDQTEQKVEMREEKKKTGNNVR